MIKKIILFFQLMRLHRPIGILLLLWPGLWALWLAHHGYPGHRLFGIFLLGTLLTRSAGCVINDIFDRNFDRHVERTQYRPLTAGKISLREACVLLVIIAFACLWLALQLNRLAFLLCLLAGVVAALYPLVKRISYFPQLILGVAFAMPVPIAYAASINHIPLVCYGLFLLAIIWPLFYDTAYALTDLQDDLKIGIKSTAVFFQQKSIWFIAILQQIFCVGFLALALFEHLRWPFFTSLAAGEILMVYQLYLIRHNKPFQAFLNNQWIGLLLWLGIVFSF